MSLNYTENKAPLLIHMICKEHEQHIILLLGGTVFITTSRMSTADDSVTFASSASWPEKPEGPGSSASCVNGWLSAVGETS